MHHKLHTQSSNLKMQHTEVHHTDIADVYNTNTDHVPVNNDSYQFVEMKALFLYSDINTCNSLNIITAFGVHQEHHKCCGCNVDPVTFIPNSI